MVAGDIFGRYRALLLGVGMMQAAGAMASTGDRSADAVAVLGRFDVTFEMLPGPPRHGDQAGDEGELPKVRADPRPKLVAEAFKRMDKIVQGGGTIVALRRMGGPYRPARLIQR